MVIAFVILLASPGFGQTDYSDAWVDDSNPDAPLIVAAGVTDYDYSADEVGVEITLPSPQGRMASGGDDNYGFAVAEVTLPWDWLDLGSYTLTTVHQPLCERNYDDSLIYEFRSGGSHLLALECRLPSLHGGSRD